MRVIGAGWGRTGTTSLAAGLERLGLDPCLKMRRLWEYPDVAELWNRHHAGIEVDWRAALAGWRSTTDWPGCWQGQEFAGLWPEAPIILTVRPSQAWYASVLGSIHPWTAPGKDPGPEPVAKLLDFLWDSEFGGWGRVLDKNHAIARCEEHNQSVANCARQAA